MNPKQAGYEAVAKTIIKNLKKRNMDGYYVNTAAEAVSLVSCMLPKGAVVASGGSLTLKETGIFDLITGNNYNFISKDATTPEENKELNAKTINADAFFMSTNAITLEGELVNIDGTGNRLAYLIFGPETVYVIAGMNKLVTNTEEGIHRVHNIASPPNAMRLNRKTPCASTGCCSDCLSPDCICSNTVITRRSIKKGRIKVILIGDSFGL